MRILMLSQFYPPVIGGEERHVRNLSLEMVLRGHEVEVATMSDGTPVRTVQDGIAVHRLNGWGHRHAAGFSDPDRIFAPPFPDPHITRSLQRIVHDFKPDVVHAHNWMVNSYLPLRLAGGPPLVLTLHDYSHRCSTKRFMRDGVGLCSGPGPLACISCAGKQYKTGVGGLLAASNAGMVPIRRHLLDAVISVSNAVAVRNRVRLRPRESEYIIPNFIPSVGDLTFGADKRPLPVEWEELAPPILYVGDLSRNKGVPELLAAYDNLDADKPPLAVIGKPVDVTPRPGGGVHVFHSWAHEDVIAAMLTATVVVVPSTWPDPCPTVVLEAMACGRPVVAAASGGIVDMIDDGATGLLVPPGDVGALTASLRRVLEDRASAEVLGVAARRDVRRFEVTEVASQVESVYRSALARHAA